MLRLLFLFLLMSSVLACTSSPPPPDSVAEAADLPQEEAPPVIPESKLSLMHQMQGRWKDSRIKNAELLITGNKFVSFYRGEMRVDATFEAFEECPAICRREAMPSGIGYFIVHQPDGDYCFVLHQLVDGVLEYTPL